MPSCTFFRETGESLNFEVANADVPPVNANVYFNKIEYVVVQTRWVYKYQGMSRTNILENVEVFVKELHE